MAGLQACDPNATDTYLIQLKVKETANRVLATDSIEVMVTPEPSTVILLPTMVLGAFFLARRRQAAQNK